MGINIEEQLDDKTVALAQWIAERWEERKGRFAELEAAVAKYLPTREAQQEVYRRAYHYELDKLIDEWYNSVQRPHLLH